MLPEQKLVSIPVSIFLLIKIDFCLKLLPANPGKLSPPVFLLDIDQMKENGYPLPSWVRGNDGSDQLPKYPLPTSDGIVNETDDYINDSDRTILQDDGWLETPKLDVYIPSNSPRVYGLDCEMVNFNKIFSQYKIN